MKLNELKSTHKSQHKKLPLYAVERKNNFLALLIFTIITISFAVMVLAVYPFIETMIPAMVADFPQEIQDMFIQVAGSNTFADYFGMQMGQNWGLVSVIYGAYLGFHLVSYNFKGASSTMLYSLNLSRNQIIKTKLARLMINSVLFNVLVGVVAVAGSFIMGESLNLINALIFVGLMSLATIQIALALFGITLINPKKMNSVISILLPVIFFFFSVIAIMDESLEWFAYLSPISSVLVTTDASSVLTTGLASVNYFLVGLWTVLPLLLLGYGVWKFNRKDLA